MKERKHLKLNSLCYNFAIFLFYHFVVHEGTLVSTLQVLKAWCSRFYTEVPEKLVQWFIVSKYLYCLLWNEYYECGFGPLRINNYQNSQEM